MWILGLKGLRDTGSLEGNHESICAKHPAYWSARTEISICAYSQLQKCHGKKLTFLH